MCPLHAVPCMACRSQHVRRAVAGALWQCDPWRFDRDLRGREARADRTVCAHAAEEHYDRILRVRAAHCRFRDFTAGRLGVGAAGKYLRRGGWAQSAATGDLLDTGSPSTDSDPPDASGKLDLTSSWDEAALARAATGHGAGCDGPGAGCGDRGSRPNRKTGFPTPARGAGVSERAACV